MELAVEMMTSSPAGILELTAGTLKEGGHEDLTIFDPKAEWTVDASEFVSKSRNTPFNGRTLHGSIRKTICGGNVVYG